MPASVQDLKDRILRYVQGDLVEPLRKMSVDDFKRSAFAMRDETITVRARDIVKVLQAHLRGDMTVTDLADWTTLVFYGVHPIMIQRREWGTADGQPILYKGVSDPDGIKKVHILHEEKCGDLISEVLTELEDLGEARNEMTREEIESWIRRLSRCDSAPP